MEDAFCRSAKHFADHMHTIRRYCVLCGGAGGGEGLLLWAFSKFWAYALKV
jgi:hypothetical protein